PVRVEIPTGDKSDDVLAGGVCTGDPARAIDDAGIDEIADTILDQCFWTDVPLHEERVLSEIVVAEQRKFGRIERGAESLVVNLAVTGNPDREQLPLPARGTDLQPHILPRVGGSHRAAQVRRVRPLDQRADRGR